MTRKITREFNSWKDLVVSQAFASMTVWKLNAYPDKIELFVKKGARIPDFRVLEGRIGTWGDGKLGIREDFVGEANQ